MPYQFVVTGCLGFIGSHLTRKLLEDKHYVYGIDKETYAANVELLEEFKEYENFTYKKEDIVNLKSLPDCDYLINTAAESHVGNSIIDSKEFIRTNIEGVRNLMNLVLSKPENVRARPVFFHFGTDEEYGDKKRGSFREDAPLNPSNPYASSKAAASLLIQSYHRTYGLNYVIVRPTNNYGTHQYPEKLIPLCVKLLKIGRKIRLHDEGEPVRSWLNVKDTVRAVIKIIDKGNVNQIYNIGGKEEKKNIEIASMIVQCFKADFLDMKNQDYMIVTKKLSEEDKKTFFDLSYKREGQDVRYSVNDGKLRVLGWSPKFDLKIEIPEVVRYYRKNMRW